MLAEAVARHLGFFKGVLASDGANNLQGKQKLAAIQAMTNGIPFEYAGNASEDLGIWRAAHGAIVVAAPPQVAAAADELSNVREHFRHEARGIGVLVRALRPQQWLKNLLMFVALLTSLSFGRATAWLQSGLAFAAFCLVASGIYIVNDLLDLRADRAHPRKRQRPFAAGQLSPQTGMLMSIVLVVAGLGLGALLPWPTLPWLAGYLILTLLYSLVLKTYVVMDVVVLAGLYTLRVVVGAAAIEVPISFWLLAFSVFMFFSLALVKRCAELNLMAAVQQEATHGRDYRVADEFTLRALGIASGIASIAVFALYINAPENLARFGSPQVLWLVCPLLLYWIARMWIKTSRDEMHDDPLIFTLRDRGSRVVVAAILGVFVVAVLW